VLVLAFWVLEAGVSYVLKYACGSGNSLHKLRTKDTKHSSGVLADQWY
jgi:hypothetical protein